MIVRALDRRRETTSGFCCPLHLATSHGQLSNSNDHSGVTATIGFFLSAASKSTQLFAGCADLSIQDLHFHDLRTDWLQQHLNEL
ncbi:hypothetical protein MES4922_40298 [Mesorhizobium ventifaucium]|uniref:Uncharacterized protein n=1 Tax=Mesorhizobium ventifaucium TaxID=666020 RepID=A0ABN8K5L3_9HYPH|nr:hypothetical protein MES4922_40298 [Mesorhizobium ventifaucium]